MIRSRTATGIAFIRIDYSSRPSSATCFMEML
jgi:hypothetical protein